MPDISSIKIVRQTLLSLKLLEQPVPSVSSFEGPPSPLKTELLQKELEEALSELALSNQSQLDSSDQRRKVERTITSRRAILAPWRRLPNEILEFIFLLTQEEDLPGPFQHFPTVAQVCRRWRHISLNYPPLWCAVSLDLPRNSNLSKRHKMVDCFIQRSCQHPLRVFIKANTRPHLKNKTFNLLLDHADRWSHAVLTLNHLVGFGYERVRRSLTNLRTLELRYDGPTTLFPWAAFDLAPNLRHVHLKGSWEQADLSLPWNQLLTYQGAIIRDSPFHPLQNLTSVTDLCIKWHFTECYVHQQRFAMPNVRSLCLHFDFNLPCYQSFFDHIELPNLKKLEVNSWPGSRFSVNDIRTMISHSTTPSSNVLEELSYTGFPELEGDLTKLLRLTPNLRILDVPLPPPYDLQQFILHANRRPLVPKLHTLHFRSRQSIRSSHRTAIHELALNRCKWKDRMRPFSSDGKTYSRVSRLQIFHIIVVAPYTKIELERDHLQNVSRQMVPDWLKANEDWKILQNWKNKIFGTLLTFLFQPHIVNLVLIDEPKAMRELRSIFDEMELFEIQDVRHLHASGLHLVLYDFQGNDYGSDMQWMRELQERTRTLLDKWVPLLVQGPDVGPWTIRDHKSMTAIAYTQIS